MPAANARSKEPLGRDFTRFLAAAASSNLGDGIRLGALPLLAISLTDDARLIGLTSAATVLPWLLLGPLGGAIVDRRDRRRLMISGQLVRAIAVIILVGLITAEVASIWSVVVIAFVLGAGEVIVDSSSQAAIPQLVAPNQLDRANGRLIAAITVLDEVVGVALGAVLFSIATPLPFVVDALTFLVGASLLATIRRPLQQRPTTQTTMRADIAEGASFLIRHRLLRGIMAATATSNLAANTAFGVLVVLLVDELGASDAAFGIVLGIGAIGGVVGSMVASRLVDRIGRRRVMSAMPLLLIVSYLVNAVAGQTWMVSAAFFVAAFAIVCYNVPGQSLRQSVTPEPILGRVVATFRMVGMGAAPVGALLGGFVTQATSVRTANFVAAAIEAVSWLLLLAALRHLDESSGSPSTGDARTT